ncbi:hypothetical protein cypCar_00034000 [Cyprinus carpio]|nr:hypothetical protein cypCar_00034000 [Cyprinus carpio]
MNCPEDIFKSLSRPPGQSPADPPLKALLQRCRSLPLPTTLSALEPIALTHVLTPPAICPAAKTMTKSVVLRMRNSSTGSNRRKLYRPGSGPLHVNMSCISKPSGLPSNTASPDITAGCRITALIAGLTEASRISQHCSMTLDVQTVAVFTVIAILLLVNVILIFFMGSS